MPKKANVGSILKKHLGKEVADAMTAKIDKMIADKKSAADIEKAIQADLAAHVEQQVVSAVIAKIGPITPIKVKPIQADVKSTIGPISVSSKVGPPIQVRVSSPIEVRSRVSSPIELKVGPSLAVGPGPVARGKK